MSKRKPKVYILINSLASVGQNEDMCHRRLFYSLGKSRKFYLYDHGMPRTSIDRARNEAAKMALDLECDYVMFLDDDMIVADTTFRAGDGKVYDNVIDCMMTAKQDIVMAMSYIRGYPFHPMAFRLKRNKALRYADEIERSKEFIEPVDAVGFTCALLRTDILKKMEPPWFITSPTGTEDVYYCMRVRNEIKDAKIAVDMRCPTGHRLDPEYVSLHNVKHLRKYLENAYPGIKEQRKAKKRGDRGVGYHYQIESRVRTGENS